MSGAPGEQVVVVYERVSSAAQDLARQTVQRGRAEAEFPDAEILVVEDDGISASKVSIFDRPGSRRMCELIEAGRVAALYSDAQDRLSRGKQSEWWNFADLCEQAGTRIFIDGRELRLDDEGDEVRSALDQMIARRESTNKSHRVSTGMAEKVAEGRSHGGSRTFGYRPVPGRPGVPEQVADEVASLRRMRDLVLAGKSFSQIAAALAREGIVTAAGKPWTAGRLSRTLRNHYYAGYTRHKDELYPGRHEAVFSADEWAALQAALDRRRRAPGNGAGRPTKGSHIGINGMFRHGYCGSAAVARTTESGGRVYEYYRCKGKLDGSRPDCPGLTVRRELVDLPLLAHFEQIGLDVEATRAALAEALDRTLADTRAVREAAEREEARLQAELGKIEADYVSGALPAERYAALTAKREGGLKGARAETRRLRRREADARAEAEEQDIEGETLRYLTEIRAAVAGVITDARAESLEALRSALGQLFDGFILHGLDHTLTEPVVVPEGWNRSRHHFDPALSPPGLIIEPCPREAVVLGDDPAIPFPRLRKAALSAPKQSLLSSASVWDHP